MEREARLLAALRHLVTRKPFSYWLNGEPLLPAVVASPDGLLPVVLAEASALWEDATGSPFTVRAREDSASLIGVWAAPDPGVPAFPVMAAIDCALDREARAKVVEMGGMMRRAMPTIERWREMARRAESQPA